MTNNKHRRPHRFRYWASQKENIGVRNTLAIPSLRALSNDRMVDKHEKRTASDLTLWHNT